MPRWQLSATRPLRANETKKSNDTFFLGVFALFGSFGFLFRCSGCTIPSVSFSSSPMFLPKKSPHRTGCLVVHIIATVLLALAFIAAVVGLVMAHVDATDGTLVFGTSPASLSILAFAVTITFLMKQFKGCMSSCDVCYPPAPVATSKKK